MPWYVVAYVIVLLGLGAASTVDAVRSRRSLPFVVFDAGIWLAWPAFVEFEWHPGWAPPKAILFVLVLLAVGTSLAETWRELRAGGTSLPEGADPELSSDANLMLDRVARGFSALTGWVLILPALIAAIHSLIPR